MTTARPIEKDISKELKLYADRIRGVFKNCSDEDMTFFDKIIVEGEHMKELHLTGEIKMDPKQTFYFSAKLAFSPDPKKR